MNAADPYEDQMEAASQDAERTVTAMLTASKMLVDKASGEVVARVVREFIEAAHRGEGGHCEHFPSSPAIVFGAAHLRGVIGCASCISELAEAKWYLDGLDGAGRTCDGCAQKAAKGKTGVIQNGPLILTISLCDACCERDEATATDSSP